MIYSHWTMNTKRSTSNLTDVLTKLEEFVGKERLFSLLAADFWTYFSLTLLPESPI